MAVLAPNIELIISEIVVAATDEAVTEIPATGKKIVIHTFEGSAPGSSKADVRLVWDFGGVGEEILWSIQVDGPFPKGKSFERAGDGVKKMAVCLANGCTADYVLSGYALGVVTDA